MFIVWQSLLEVNSIIRAVKDNGLGKWCSSFSVRISLKQFNVIICHGKFLGISFAPKLFSFISSIFEGNIFLEKYFAIFLLWKIRLLQMMRSSKCEILCWCQGYVILATRIKYSVQSVNYFAACLPVDKSISILLNQSLLYSITPSLHQSINAAIHVSIRLWIWCERGHDIITTKRPIWCWYWTNQWDCNGIEMNFDNISIDQYFIKSIKKTHNEFNNLLQNANQYINWILI